jgi:hypothetical protein
VIVGLLVAVVVGAAAFVSSLSNGQVELQTRPGAGPDQSKSLPIDQCAKAPRQAVEGISQQLRTGTQLGRVVVLRPSKTSYVLAAAQITTSSELDRSGIPPGAAGLWAFENGIGATARPTEYVSKLVSTSVTPVSVDTDLAERALRCLDT